MKRIITQIIRARGYRNCFLGIFLIFLKKYSSSKIGIFDIFSMQKKLTIFDRFLFMYSQNNLCLFSFNNT